MFVLEIRYEICSKTGFFLTPMQTKPISEITFLGVAMVMKIKANTRKKRKLCETMEGHNMVHRRFLFVIPVYPLLNVNDMLHTFTSC